MTVSPPPADIPVKVNTWINIFVMRVEIIKYLRSSVNAFRFKAEIGGSGNVRRRGRIFFEDMTLSVNNNTIFLLNEKRHTRKGLINDKISATRADREPLGDCQQLKARSCPRRARHMVGVGEAIDERPFLFMVFHCIRRYCLRSGRLTEKPD